jgi:hypothetical protein
MHDDVLLSLQLMYTDQTLLITIERQNWVSISKDDQGRQCYIPMPEGIVEIKIALKTGSFRPLTLSEELISPPDIMGCYIEDDVFHIDTVLGNLVAPFASWEIRQKDEKNPRVWTAEDVKPGPNDAEWSYLDWGGSHAHAK